MDSALGGPSDAPVLCSPRDKVNCCCPYQPQPCCALLPHSLGAQCVRQCCIPLQQRQAELAGQCESAALQQAASAAFMGSPGVWQGPDWGSHEPQHHPQLVLAVQGVWVQGPRLLHVRAHLAGALRA